MTGQYQQWRKDFPYTVRHQRTTLHFTDEIPAYTRTALERLIDSPAAAKRVSAPLDCQQSALFTKREQLDSLKKKLRVHRGNPKRSGIYDWAIEEMINTCEAYRRGARVPRLLGYGYRRSRLGLVEDFFLITELLKDHVDGFTLIRRDPQAIRPLISAVLELLASLHSHDIVHMDLWAANVMLPKKGDGPAHAIDLENCFYEPTSHFSEVLGFQMGFFYYREMYRYITEADYDALVEAALGAYPHLDRPAFSEIYDISKHQDVGRLERREIFHRGVLKRHW
ncbi:hypothetical protein G7009_02505 [Pseudomonas capeferrum]|uniref:lipopolysaccharide kinase InaA family protein n=1 Tax=Pseudomonas capeferrum TaxID=1495066 RepID=UPI0015E485A1|nr:lipopolysaccharide kinase InaA family protein [Pseudomonas capeferrum]MBA1200664.1 hypothetical protein [Pseudomonas capeferrum]